VNKVLPSRLRKSGKVVGYNQVGRSLTGKGSGKIIQSGKTVYDRVSRSLIRRRIR
jgi:hypothetical protein